MCEFSSPVKISQRLKVINQFQHNLSIYSHHTYWAFLPSHPMLSLVLHAILSLTSEHMQNVHKINNLWFTHHHWFLLFFHSSIYEVHIAMWQSWKPSKCSNKLNDLNIYALAFWLWWAELMEISQHSMNINWISKLMSTWEKVLRS